MPSAVGIYFAALLVLYLLYSLPMSYIKVGGGAGAQDRGMAAKAGSGVARRVAGQHIQCCSNTRDCDAPKQGLLCAHWLIVLSPDPIHMICSTIGATMQQRYAAFGTQCWHTMCIASAWHSLRALAAWACHRRILPAWLRHPCTLLATSCWLIMAFTC